MVQKTTANPLKGSDVKIVPLAEENFWSFVVSIQSKVHENSIILIHFCTGSLVTRTHVITAAHCLNGKYQNNIRLKIGSTDTEKGYIFEPKKIITYENWARNHESKVRHEVKHDIAIITVCILLNYIKKYIINTF